MIDIRMLLSVNKEMPAGKVFLKEMTSKYIPGTVGETHDLAIYKNFIEFQPSSNKKDLNYLKHFDGTFGINFGWFRIQICLVQVDANIMPFVVHHKVGIY